MKAVVAGINGILNGSLADSLPVTYIMTERVRVIRLQTGVSAGSIVLLVLVTTTALITGRKDRLRNNTVRRTVLLYRNYNVITALSRTDQLNVTSQQQMRGDVTSEAANRTPASSYGCRRFRQTY